MNLNVFLSFLSGILSFLSPCVLPIIPSFLSVISGVASKEFKNYRARVFLSSLFFVFGFSLVFSVLGIISIGILSSFQVKTLFIIKIVGALFIIIFALDLMFDFIPLFKRQFKLQLKSSEGGFLSSFLMGASFSLGWTPCIGPALSSIFLLSASSSFKGIYYLSAYSLGFSIPFLVIGLLYYELTDKIEFLKKNMKAIKMLSGILLLILGFVLLSSALSLSSILISFLKPVLSFFNFHL